MCRIIYLSDHRAMSREELAQVLANLERDRGGGGFGVGCFPERGGEPFLEKFPKLTPEETAELVKGLPEGRPVLIHARRKFKPHEELIPDYNMPHLVRDRRLGRAFFAQNGDIEDWRELAGVGYISDSAWLADLINRGEEDFFSLVERFSHFGVLVMLTEEDRFIWKQDPTDPEDPAFRDFTSLTLERDGMRYLVVISNPDNLGELARFVIGAGISR